MNTITTTNFNFPGQKSVYRGKVREVYNINDDNSSISFAPTRTFEFDDSSSAYVSYGGVFVIEPNQPY